MEKAYKFRIYPNSEQERTIAQNFGCCRFVYNHFLALRIELYETDGATLGFSDLCRELTALKDIYPWLREADSTALQSSLRDLDVAYQNFFRRVKQCEKPGFPRFKSKRGNSQSYRAKRVGDNIAVLDRHIKLPKLGLVSASISKQVRGRILNATVSKSPTGKYYVSLCCTDVDIDQLPSTGAAVGLDMGITDLVVDSDGNAYPNHKHVRQSEKRLARAQRSLSRKQKGSRNREKSRARVARIHEKIANQRADTLHKLTTQFVRDNDIICIEDLAIKNMIRNHSLAKSIADASWGELARQLQYKCEWQHKVLVKVGRFFASSQICSACGHLNPDVVDLQVRSWRCDTCGAMHNRDTNAARNILNEGMRKLA